MQLDLFDPPPALSAPETAPERHKGTFPPPVPERCEPLTAQKRTNPALFRPGARSPIGPAGASAPIAGMVGRLRSPRGGATEASAPVSGADFAALLPDVARLLLGDPPRIEAGGATWRYRGRGSLAVHVGGAHAGTWRGWWTRA